MLTRTPPLTRCFVTKRRLITVALGTLLCLAILTYTLTHHTQYSHSTTSALTTAHNAFGSSSGQRYSDGFAGLKQVMAECGTTGVALVVYDAFHTFCEIITTYCNQLRDMHIVCYIVEYDMLHATPDVNTSTILYVLFNAYTHPAPFTHAPHYAVFNWEQAGSNYVRMPDYIAKMNGGVVLFDYSAYNRQQLTHVRNDIVVWPYMYHTSLTHWTPNYMNDEPIDILFYGVINENRQLYSNLLQSSLPQYKIQFTTSYDLFGDVLMAEIKRAKMVLNLHYYTNPSVLEVSRIIPLVANHKLVISEHSTDVEADARLAEMVVFVDSSNIVQVCDMYLQHPELRLRYTAQAFLKLVNEEIT